MAEKIKHVPPEKFARIRDRAHMRNADVARALSVSPSRVTELTRSKGGSDRQFAAFKETLLGQPKPRIQIRA